MHTYAEWVSSPSPFYLNAIDNLDEEFPNAQFLACDYETKKQKTPGNSKQKTKT